VLGLLSASLTWSSFAFHIFQANSRAWSSPSTSFFFRMSQTSRFPLAPAVACIQSIHAASYAQPAQTHGTRCTAYTNSRHPSSRKLLRLRTYCSYLASAYWQARAWQSKLKGSVSRKAATGPRQQKYLCHSSLCTAEGCVPRGKGLSSLMSKSIPDRPPLSLSHALQCKCSISGS